MVGMVNAPASAEDKALSLLSFLSDKDRAAKAVADYAAAKDAAEAKIAEAAKQEKANAEREAELDARGKALDAKEAALHKDAYNFGFESDQLDHEKETFRAVAAEAAAKKAEKDKELSVREDAVFKAEKALAMREAAVAVKEIAASEAKSKYENLLAGAKKILGG